MSVTNPDKERFERIAKECDGGPIPFVIRLPNDQHTPVSIYSNLRDSSDHAFFLESVEMGVRLGRYSFMGASPRKVVTYREGRFKVRGPDGETLEELSCDNPLERLERFMAPYRSKWPESYRLPPLVGGLVGYLGYDCVNYFEPVGEMLEDEIGLPEMAWMLVDRVVCFDHLHSQIVVSKCVLPEDGSGEGMYERLVEETEDYCGKVLRPADLPSRSMRSVIEGAPGPLRQESNFSEAEYCAVVERAKAHIHDGDIFQIVPSQRFSSELVASPLDVYRALRKLNPSSYMFALKIGEHEAVGSSPETQLRCERGRMMMRPLAGTRRRTGDDERDAELARELLADEKECAEHRMLVDLVRNDLGRVAKVGSVAITRLLEVEHYSHVMHITSEVEADLMDGKSVFDALRATFPAGTLSGAPKVRAMQLINEFEPVRRNVYGGLVGYIDFSNNCDTCIAIRMMVARGDKAWVQAGGGVVADSVPEAEYQETLNKARAVLMAIAEANAWR